MQQERIALRVQAHGHSADWALDDVALESDALRFEIVHEAINVLDFESDRSAGCGARRIWHEIGEGQRRRREGRIQSNSARPGCPPSRISVRAFPRRICAPGLRP